LVTLGRRFYGNGTIEEQWQRIVLNRETLSIVESLKPGDLDVLEVSGDTWHDRVQFGSYRSVQYPDFDICGDTLSDRFDLIIAEQVFEHLLWPYRAARNVHTMLRTGGHFLISTPFMIPVHECPHDCTRWTPNGMKHFLAECGFALDRIQVHSWGNLRCLKRNLRRWQVYQPWRHSLRNEPRYPVQVWALAAK
jgi:SAM-dependent methyltransferase